MIENSAIRLRAVEPEDVDLLYNWENDMALWQVSNTLTPFSRSQLQRYVSNAQLDLFQTKQLRLMIDSKQVDSSVVTVGIIDLFSFDVYNSRAGVGILIHSSFHKQGYAKIALKLFVNYCFTVLGLHQLYCSIGVGNTASMALFKAEGFELIGIKKEWCKTKTGYEDEAFLQLLSSNHLNN